MTVEKSTEPRPLQRPVRVLNKVGPERAELLGRLGIRTVEDLLLHGPRRYEDRRHFRTIKELVEGEQALCRGTIVALGVKWWAQRRKSIFEFVLDDGTGRLHCRWWNLPFMEKNFNRGDNVVVFGKLRGVKPRNMDHPETEVLESDGEESAHIGRITPVYPLTEGVSQKWLRGLIWRTLHEYEAHLGLPESAEGTLAPCLSPFKLPTRAVAVRWLHAPEDLQQPDCARARLAFDEFLGLQLQLQQRRRSFCSHASGLPCKGTNRLIKPFLDRLEFKLTQSQTRVLREIRQDMGGAHPMRRLLQGDVGSGKTVVAVCTGLMAIESGFSVVFMAPTEILAQQHYRTLTRWLEPLRVRIEIVTGCQKSISHQGHSQAGPAIYVGTHALIQSTFNPERLGLVIIDEQHKFGVAQREELLRKGHYPHLLVMTATPIPRTLGLTLYGDLDSSVLDQAPAGRGKIRTFLRQQSALPNVWTFLRGKLEEGRQAYIVYPRVEDTAGNVKAVTKEITAIQVALNPFPVEVLHGKLAPEEKERTMARFRNNELKVVIATSLVEVGVDVPNATVMIIENAEQFGLAQLHQLRGRIGRGGHESYCILVSGASSPEETERLKVLESSSDGFAIAEADLKLRGPGEFLGQDQSGAPSFRFGDLRSDLALVQAARAAAKKVLDTGSAN